MKIYIALGLLFQISAVFQGVLSTSESSWTIFVSEDGTVEIIDKSASIEQSNSTLEELKEDVLFYLYTSSNPEDGQQIYFEENDTLSASNFNAENPTRIVIHGYLSSASKTCANGTRDAYLGAGDFNIILVDWTAYSNKDYITARRKIVPVGEYIGLMIDYLEYNGMKISDLIIIGHSLGAHIAGIAGRSALSDVPILIGLDPAGVLFTGDSYSTLRSTDANFVQVIHTSAGTLGYNGNLGDVDIWVNGGWTQNGCGLDLFRTCAHSRSYFYYAEAITNNLEPFLAHKCDSNDNYNAEKCAENESTYLGGLDIDTTANGTFYVNTNSASTYAMS